MTDKPELTREQWMKLPLYERAALLLEASEKLWSGDARLWPHADQFLKPTITELRALSGGVAPPLVKILRDQRDECADALRGLLPLAKSYEGQYPLGPNGAIEVAESVLEKIPTYERRLTNIFEAMTDSAPAGAKEGA